MCSVACDCTCMCMYIYFCPYVYIYILYFIHLSQRAFVEVQWTESEEKTTHMVGHEGKVRARVPVLSQWAPIFIKKTLRKCIKYSLIPRLPSVHIHYCTTEALEIKRAASSVCLRRIVALCGLGVYVVRPGVYGVPSQQILYSMRPSRAKTGFPAHSVVQTGYTTPTLRFSDTLNRLVGVV